jgi:hypothetical protein
VDEPETWWISVADQKVVSFGGPDAQQRAESYFEDLTKVCGRGRAIRQ